MTGVAQQQAKLLAIGANGQLRNTMRVLLERSDARPTLGLRRASRLTNPDLWRVEIVEGDALDRAALRSVMRGRAVDYGNRAGAMTRHARRIIDAMHETGNDVRESVGVSRG